MCPYPKLHALPSHRTRRIGIWGSWRISHRHLVAQFHARMDLLELCARVFAYEAIEPPSHSRACVRGRTDAALVRRKEGGNAQVED